MPWQYFGGKNGLARKYPPPTLTPIIEPFAGAAGYSCYWARPGQRVLLFDKDPDVIRIWRDLQGHGATRLPRRRGGGNKKHGSGAPNG